MSVKWAIQTLLDYAKAEEVNQDLADQLATALENVLLSLAQHSVYVSTLMGRYQRELEEIDARENEL